MNTLINENNTINQEHLDLIMEKFDTNPDNASWPGEQQEYNTEYNVYIYKVDLGSLTIINKAGSHTIDVDYYTTDSSEETA